MASSKEFALHEGEDSCVNIVSDPYTNVPGYEKIALICVADCRGYNTKSMCLALKSVDTETQTYERFGIVTFKSSPSRISDLGFESKAITIV